jgi:uncharacterized membrane protein YhaH (DUF805 family)
MANGTADPGYRFNLAYALTTTLDAVTVRFFDVTGRSSRRAFWHYYLVIVCALVALSVLSAIPILGFIFWLTLMVTYLALMLPSIGMMVRRMHDVGQPWFMGLIPLYNLYLAVQPGEPGPNVYGPAPQD